VPDFGKYVNSTERPLREAFGTEGFERLSRDWSMSTIRGLEGVGVTRVNRDVGRLLESSLERINLVKDAKDVSDGDKQTQIEKSGAKLEQLPSHFSLPLPAEKPSRKWARVLQMRFSPRTPRMP
jgi:hypothetical protein